MKWYWILIIAAVVLGVAYWVAIKSQPSPYRASCRAGTCPVILGDGTVFCTSAACKKDNNNKVVYENVVPTRNVFAGVTGINNVNGLDSGVR